MAKSTTTRFCATALFGLLLSTTAVPVVAQTIDEFAARGEVLAAADPRAAELRAKLDDAGRRGFDIGMGGTEGDAGMGPGKQARGESLPADQQDGYFAAVLFSVTRNANAAAANLGMRIARGDSNMAHARWAEDDGFYALGFDIATGLLYDSGSGLFGGIEQTVGAETVHNSLTGATRRGFEASARLHGRNYGSFPGKSTPITPPDDYAVSDSTTDGTAGVDRVGSVPDVAGMTISEAKSTLSYAGFEVAEAEINIGPAQPPYDRVLATRPAAGTSLPRESRVEVQVPRAWILRGNGTLISNDPRIGFDFDTGRNALVEDGADISANYRTPERERAWDPKLQLSFFNPGPGVTMVPADRIDGSNPHSAITNGQAYHDCERSLRTKQHIAVEHGGGEFCITTPDEHTVRLSIAQDREGNFNFSYATFAGNGGIAKAQGRVIIPGSPVKKLPICEAAKAARDRNSPAATIRGLTQQCLASGGTVPQ